MISCKGIIVNRNVVHSFKTHQKLHVTMVLEPAASVAEQISVKMNGAEFWILDEVKISQGMAGEESNVIGIEELQKSACGMAEAFDRTLILNLLKSCISFWEYRKKRRFTMKESGNFYEKLPASSSNGKSI